MIVAARFKARFDDALASGWQAERFARTKTMKPLGDYLKPPPSPAERREAGAQKLRALFERAATRKGQADGDE